MTSGCYMKSIEFVKERIRNRFVDLSLQENAKFSELKFEEYINSNTAEEFRKSFVDGECKLILNSKAEVNGEKLTGDFVINIRHDENTDFEYFTMERCTCDGTLIFMLELVERVFMKVLRCKTINNEKVPSDFNNNPFDYEICYTVGDFVICDEYGDFGTKEKPWMKSRFTVMLPIKFDMRKKRDRNI